jgi:hypothetical protein
MSSATGVLVMASGVQGGHARAPGQETLLVALIIAAMAVASVLIFVYIRRRYRRLQPVDDQWQALAVMGEMCPDGWQAQITVYGRGSPMPDDAPRSRAPLVELEWKQFDDQAGEVAVARRAWASSIGEALRTMVEDRQTDITLEQIEQAAQDGGASWSD